MEETVNETVETTETPETLTFTQEELDLMLQREGDKRVEQAMRKAKKKQELAVAEAEKLAKMSEEEKYRHELEQREARIAEKEKELAIMANKSTAMDILAEKGISTKLVDFVLAEDAEDMMANISLLEEEFKRSVKIEIEKRLQTSTPRKSLPNNEGLTAEQFRKLPLSEQARIYAENPEQYAQLTGNN